MTTSFIIAVVGLDWRKKYIQLIQFILDTNSYIVDLEKVARFEYFHDGPNRYVTQKIVCSNFSYTRFFT